VIRAAIISLLVASAITNNWNISQLSVHDGLSSTYVTKIIQCSDGYLYFGTQLGVNRYDGRSIISISLPETNPDLLSIRDLGEDCFERIWILSDAGICRLNSGEFFATEQHYLNNDVPIRMVGAGNGEFFYFVLKDSSLHRINVRTDKEEQLCSGVKFLCSDMADRIYYSDTAGYLNVSRVSTLTTDRIIVANPEEIIDAGIPALHNGQPDWSHALRLRTTEKYLFLDMATHTVIINLENNVASIKNYQRLYDATSLPNGEIFVAAKGISVIDSNLVERHVFLNDGEGVLKDNFTNTTCLDREGGIWIGTRYQGVYHFSNNYSELSIVDFYRTVGVTEAYTSHFNINKNGTIEIGTTNAGTISFNPESNEFRHMPRQKIKRSSTLVLDDGTVYSLKKEKLEVRKGDKSRIVNTPSNRNIFSLADKDKEFLWVASATAGLWKMKIQDETFEKIDIFNDISGYSVKGIDFAPNGYLWGVTDRGVFRLDTHDNTVRIFSKMDGFPTGGYTGAISISPDGIIYIGLLNGFLSFNPNLVAKKFSANRILFTDFQRLGSKNAESFPKEPVHSSSLDLPYESNSFSLGVSDMSFAMPAVSALQYRIPEISNTWAAVTEGRIVIANLSAGKYHLEVRQDPNYPENGSQTVLGITIHPHPLLSFWAFLLYAVLIAGAICLSVMLVKKKERDRAIVENERKAAKNAKDLYDSKVGFLSNVVHSIGTPLTIAKSISSSLQSRFSSSPDLSLTSDIQFISRSIENISSIINDFAGISTLDGVSIRKNLVECNINDIVKSVFRRFSLAARQKGLSFELKMPTSHISSSVDKIMLEKILSCIMSNAVKYSAKRFSVLMRVYNNTIEIIEENDGNIIPVNLREKIFEPFFQLSTYSNQNNTISGFGLHISRTLAQEMGGTLKMDEDSSVNRFILSLPIKHLSDIFSESVKKSIDKPTSKPLLLIADSNSDLVSYLNNQVEDIFFVVSFIDGKSALNFVQSEEKRFPDIIISNVFLPEINGFELCRQIKSNSQSCHIPVILISSDNEGSQSISDKCGADLLLIKPFTIERLLSSIHNLLEGRKRLKEHYRRSVFVHSDKVASSSRSILVSELDQFLSDNIQSVNLGVEDMASAVNMSSSNLQKKLKSIVNMSPIEYLTYFRMNRATTLLENDNLSIQEISTATGYDSQTYFTKVFKKHYGMGPREYRKKIILPK